MEGEPAVSRGRGLQEPLAIDRLKAGHQRPDNGHIRVGVPASAGLQGPVAGHNANRGKSSSAQAVGWEDEGLTTETRKHGGEVA